MVQVPWPPSVAQVWTGAGASSSLPINTGFVSCSLQWGFYTRLRLAAAAPLLVIGFVVPVLALREVVTWGRRWWTGTSRRARASSSSSSATATTVLARLRSGCSRYWSGVLSAVMMLYFLIYPTVVRLTVVLAAVRW